MGSTKPFYISGGNVTHDVSVRQLKSVSEQAFLNVDEKEGHIGVWASCYHLPVYLLQNGIHVYLMVFDNEDWAREWLDEHQYRFSHITRLAEVETNPSST